MKIKFISSTFASPFGSELRAELLSVNSARKKVLPSLFRHRRGKVRQVLIIAISICAVIVGLVAFSYYSKTVKLYYYNPNLDRDETGNILCSRKGLVAVERRIPISKTPIQDTIKLLIAGQLTEEEKSQGITTEYPLEGFSLKGASLKDRILTLEFEDPNYKTGGGSCRVGILWFQIEATAKQSPEVQEVRFLPEELFQP